MRPSNSNHSLPHTPTLAVLFGVLLWPAVPLAPADPVETPLTYEQHIRPIFRTHCFDCHGAGEELRGALDLRLVRSIERGGKSGRPAIVRGAPETSFLLERIRRGEMPPGEHKVSPDEIATIARWIAAGAATARPEPESIGPGLGVTAEERAFWAFQPIRRPEVRDPRAFAPQERVRTPIDALVLEHAESAARSTPADATASAAFAPDAAPRTLILRAFFDLIGLPPSPAEVEQWLAEADAEDANDAWFDRLVDALLESPHYGERWARHWLDVAGYADSEGYTAADAERPWAWKYRDWVVRALNDDRPFDRFITEQLAGDELAGPRAGDLTGEQIELLTATGFLRMAADGTGSGADNADGRNQVVADTLEIVGTSLLALSVQCAQCHDHRYDPIPQTDYYALRAVFEPALDWQAWKTPGARLVSLYTAADRERAAAVEAEAQAIAAERATKQAEYIDQALAQELAKFDEPLRSQLHDAYRAPGDRRTEEQKQLLATHPSVDISAGVLYQYLPAAAEDLKKFDQRISETRAKKPVEEFVRALVEPEGHAPQTKRFFRGDHQQAKETIAPAALRVASPEDNRIEFPSDDPALPTTGRRLAFAGWLTSDANPLFARAIVNRVWMHHFGRGLVATPADFGRLGARPSHPQLLDWLAGEFRRSGWSLKQLHRLILTSTVWRQSSELASSAFPLSPRRLDAETLRDRMLRAAGQLDRTLHGAPVRLKDDDARQVVVDGPETRRSLYLQARRSRPVAMLEAFDAPVMETNCESRASSTVATQSLMLLNGEFIVDVSTKVAERAAREATPPSAELLADCLGNRTPDALARPIDGALEVGVEVGGEVGGEVARTPSSPDELGGPLAALDAVPGEIIRAWELVLCRPPQRDELVLAMNFVTRQLATFAALPSGVPAGRTPARQATTNLCQVLLSSNEFLHVE